jgi:hypothetical protein
VFRFGIEVRNVTALRFDVLTVVTVKIAVFWDVLCSNIWEQRTASIVKVEETQAKGFRR